MKYFIILTLTLCGISTSSFFDIDEVTSPAIKWTPPATEVVHDDPALQRDKGLLLYNKVPFSGILKEYFMGGQQKSATAYLNGRRHGKAQKWYADGTSQHERFYTNGRKSGVHHGWWPNGQLQYRYEFESGQHHGALEEWYQNGSQYKSFTYVAGKESGLQRAWRENGKLFVNYVVKNGRRYGMVKSRLCFSIQETEDEFVAAY